MMKLFRSLGLGTRVIAVTILILITVVAVNYVVFITNYRADSRVAMVEKAAAFTAVAEEAKNHTSKLNQSGAFDTDALLAELQQGMADDPNYDYTQSKIFGTIPVVAGWKAAEEAAALENIEFRITSFEARNKKNEPTPGTFEAELLTDLTNQVKAGGEHTIDRIDEATNSLHYMRAITLDADCLMCHGKPGNKWDTDNDGKDPLGFPMESWPKGYMHGSYHVVLPLDTLDKSVAGFMMTGLAWTVPLVVGAGLLFVVFMKFTFGNPINNLTERIRDIAEGEGDLTQRVAVNSDDELGRLGKYFNMFVGRLHDVICEVSAATHEVAGAATQIAASSEEMAAGIDEQNTQVAQVSSAIEEMSATVVEVARKAGDAANAAEDSGKTATEGGEVVSQTITGMGAINEAVTSSAQSVRELGKRGDQIGEVITVINDIADQTNLLALNAAIEAARAGEHGRGFAVVADEVRKLADRTTKATDEIRESITAMQSETTQAVERMEGGTAEVERGVELATQAGSSLEAIVNRAQEVASMIQSIAAATEEQSAASDEVSRSIEGIASVSRQTAEGASQAAQAASQLSAKSEQLQQLVGTFKVDNSKAGMG